SIDRVDRSRRQGEATLEEGGERGAASGAGAGGHPVERRPGRLIVPSSGADRSADPRMRIGILGATGPAGSGLAARLASVGHQVLFGSRALDRAQQAVAELGARWGGRVAGLVACDNSRACDAPVVVLAVQAGSAIPTVKEHAERLVGKVVVSMANNLVRSG